MKKAHQQLASAFEAFARNGRWGTCSGCPQDGAGRVLPELCVYTQRYDHQLTFDALADTYRRYAKDDPKDDLQDPR